MKIALVQMVSGADVARNMAQALEAIAQAADSGCELIALPEYFCLLGAHDADKLTIAESADGGPLQEALRKAARDKGVWLLAGTVPLKSDQPDRVFNACLVFDPQGQVVARYDKIHLFAFDNGTEHYDESRILCRGARPVAFDLRSSAGEVWRVGLSVCYDLRFPELYRALGADMVFVPSAFTYTTGQAHWETLLRARAIENLAYVLAPAQGGVHENGRRTWGHSMVVDPWGRVLAQREQGMGLVTAQLDLAALRKMRQQLPALAHRCL